MNNAVNFLLESGVSLALLSLVYILFLRKETFFHLNRVFLLISVSFSVILPFMHLRVYQPQSVMLPEVTVTQYRNLVEAVTIYGQDISGVVTNTIISNRLLIYSYLIGLLIFSIRFIVRISQIILLIKKSEVEKHGKINYVILNKDSSPFSFLNFIFINPKHRVDSAYDKIVTHEIEHIRQGHSFDVLLLEVLTILQWFNPFMWIMKRVIRENHEFLADRAVLDKGVNAGLYKQLLLKQTFGFQPVIANNFNASIIKKRIKMISKIKSSKIANLKYLFGALSLLTLLVVFACEQKEDIQANELMNEQKIVLDIEGKQLIITGNDAENQVKSLLSQGKYDVNSKEVDGITYLTALEKEEVVSKSIGVDEQIFFIVEEMPEFPGGDMALRKFIANSVKYPEDAQNNDIQGKVYVSFVVGKDGYVKNAKIARGVAPSLDKEALRVVNSIPMWKPGKQRGQYVNVSYTVPINFVLQ